MTTKLILIFTLGIKLILTVQTFRFKSYALCKAKRDAAASLF